MKFVITTINRENEEYRPIKFDTETPNNLNFINLINDSINLILCITDNYSDLWFKEFIEFGIIQDLDILYYKSCEIDIKEKIDNLFRIFFFLYKVLLIKNLHYFNTILESGRFFDVLLQAYFPQENSSDLNILLNEKIQSFVEDILKKQDVNNYPSYPNVYKFFKSIKDNCNLFMQEMEIDDWKKDKIFLKDGDVFQNNFI